MDKVENNLFRFGSVDIFSEKQTFQLNRAQVLRLRSFRLAVVMTLKHGRYFKYQRKYNLCNSFYDLPKDIVLEEMDTFASDFSGYFDIWWKSEYKKLIPNMSLEKRQRLYRRLFYWCWCDQDMWFDPDNYDWHHLSEYIVKETLFREWWKKYKNKINFNDRDVLKWLPRNGYESFNKWWDFLNQEQKDLLRIIAPDQLASNCHKRFDTWFDKDKIDLRYCLSELIQWCPKQFDTWWNEKKIKEIGRGSLSWKSNSSIFVRKLSDKFDQWFDKKYFNYDHLSYVLPAKFPKKFDQWFDEKYFNYCNHVPWTYRNDKNGKSECYTAKHLLMKHCSKHFHKWWNKVHFKAHPTLYELLKKYCQDYKDVWAEEYIMYALKNE